MAGKAQKFNNDEQRAIARAAQQVWDEIGGDCLQALAEDKGRTPESVTMSRRDVIALVLDANRFEDALARLLRRDASSALDPQQLLARVREDIYGQRSEIERYLKTDVFKYSRYGF